MVDPLSRSESHGKNYSYSYISDEEREIYKRNLLKRINEILEYLAEKTGKEFIPCDHYEIHYPYSDLRCSIFNKYYCYATNAHDESVYVNYFPTWILSAYSWKDGVDRFLKNQNYHPQGWRYGFNDDDDEEEDENPTIIRAEIK